MKKIIKIIISLALIILFWISGYFGVLKILEIKEQYDEKQEEKEMIEKLTNEIGEIDFNFENYEKEQRLKEEKEEIKRLKATIVYNSKECKTKSNSSLWQNKMYGFKMCVPSDYLGYSPYAGRFTGGIFDGTEGIGLDNNNSRYDGYFSSIWILSYEKPYKLNDNNFKGLLFETKTHIVKIDFDKNNKEHLEAIKSLKLYDANKKIIIDKKFFEKPDLNDLLLNSFGENN